ncbi:MAG TPA: hypothetical protein VJT50_07055 [Pyrinomonadaceae bacterium]|nr:hypothetical protein [Pyrinomonadaceae bacterium]
MKRIRNLVALAGTVLWLFASGAAQSTDVATPTPVRGYEISGAIAARDIGDARLTDHFYAFTGTPGDLLITVDSRNMNGDIDVFTAVGLRPLLKFTIYDSSSAPITKSIYLRQRQDLILRVEARTPNDDDAVYHIRFGGGFAPIEGPAIAENETANQPVVSDTKPAKKGRRVSSTGARIEEPAEPEVAAAPTPEPAAVETPESVTPKPSTRSSRNRRPARGSKRTETAAKPTEENPETVAASPETTPVESKPAPRRRGSRRPTTRKPEVPEPEPNTGPRLVIETNDGTLIDRYMTTVRRVTVENGLVVITGKDGKIDRVLLANVVKMSIAP